LIISKPAFRSIEKELPDFQNQIALFSLFDGVISDVAKTLPNAVLEVQKSSIYAGLRRFHDYSNSIVDGGFDVMS
jgi:hypothetical protein